ncbi:MAG: DUF2442 domain-containing protein [Chloroflexota bacterium]
MIPDRDRPIAVDFTDVDLYVTLANQRRLTLPLADYPVLAQARAEQRMNLQLTLNGLYWPELDLDISLMTLLSGTVSPTRRHKPRFCEG